jgi:hypothetical protein
MSVYIIHLEDIRLTVNPGSSFLTCGVELL